MWLLCQWDRLSLFCLLFVRISLAFLRCHTDRRRRALFSEGATTGVAPTFVRWRERPQLINACTSAPAVIHSSDISTLLPLKPSDITLWPSDLINFLFPERLLPLAGLWATESDRRVPHCRHGMFPYIYFEGHFRTFIDNKNSLDRNDLQRTKEECDKLLGHTCQWKTSSN